MVEETQNNGGAVTPTSEPQTPPAVEPNAGEGADEWFGEAKQRGFKEPKAVWDSYKESEKKISLQGEELKKYREFQEQVEPILSTIWEDEELRTAVQSKVSGKPAVAPSKKREEAAPPPVDSEARNVLQNSIMSDFEKEVGIDKLDDDSKKQIRGMIGKEMTRWVKEGQLPIQGLDGIVRDAFTLAKAKNGQLSKMLTPQAEADEDGIFPSSSSGSISPQGEVRLTPEQEKVASRMPGGRDAYVKGLRKLIKK